MITICLVLMTCLAALPRGRSILSPSWLATCFGALSISTWGFLGVSSFTLDAFLGGHNWLTLVRDLLATTSFWYYRRAVSRATHRPLIGPRRLHRWLLSHYRWARRRVFGNVLLFALMGSYAIPFALIENKGHTSSSFVLNRLDQPAMWLFASLYMGTLLLLSLDSLRMLSRPQEATVKEGRLLTLIALGFVLVIIACLLELGYLTTAFSGYGGEHFRVEYYYVAQWPFFAGLIAIGLGIAWNAISVWARFRRTAIMLLAFIERKRASSPVSVLEQVKLAFTRKPRQPSVGIFMAILDDIARERYTLTPAEREWLDKVRAHLWPEPGSMAPEIVGAAQ